MKTLNDVNSMIDYCVENSKIETGFELGTEGRRDMYLATSIETGLTVRHIEEEEAIKLLKAEMRDHLLGHQSMLKDLAQRTRSSNMHQIT